MPAGVTQFQFLHPFCRNGHSFVWTFNEHVSVDLEGCQYPDLKFSITLFSGQFLLRDTCAIEHHVLSFVVSVNRLSDIAIPVHIGFALYLGRQMSFDRQMNRSCSFLFNTMVSWSKNRNGRQVLSWCTGYAVLPHQFFLSGSMQQNPVAEDQVFVIRFISKEWYFLCRRLAIVVDVWGCRQLSVTWVTVFTAYTSVIRPLSCRLYMDGTVFRFLYVWCNNVPDVGDRKNFGLIRVSGTTGQVCFCALFPG